jgi:uncharacterized protein
VAEIFKEPIIFSTERRGWNGSCLVEDENSSIIRKPQIMGKFITLTGSDGRYYFILVASNGQIILSSEGFTTDYERDSSIHAIHAKMILSSSFEKKMSSDGKYYFILRAADGEIIGHSELYGSAAGRDNGIEAVINNARYAEVEMTNSPFGG